MKGGYIIIDCSGLDLTKGATEQTITGLYNTVKNAFKTNKPIFAYNTNWGNNGIVTPIQVFVIDFGTRFICTSSTLQVIVSNKDKITINNMIVETPGV